MNSAGHTIKQFIPPGSALYYSVRYLPVDLRPVITLLFTFSRLLQEIPLECSDNQVARQKLQWWRIDCERFFSRTPTHPLTQALLPLLLPENGKFAFPHHLLAKSFNQCIDALELQLEQQIYETQEELENYYIEVCAIERLALQIVALPEELPEAYSKQLCCSWQVSQRLQQFRRLLLRHQAKFSRAQLQEITLADLEACLHLNMQKKQSNSAAVPLLKNLHQQSQNHYQQALASLDKNHSKQQRLKQLPFLIYTELQLQAVNVIAAEGYPVFTHSVDLTPLRKLWLARRIKHRENKLYQIN